MFDGILRVVVVLFNSFEFAVFLPVVLVLYFIFNHRWQNRMLLVAGYFFYGCWDWRFLSLLWISTLVDFAIARCLEGAEGRRRKYLLSISLVSNLGMLGFFKYCNFFVYSAASALERIGLEPHLPTLHIVLPMGISFYTFQSLSYTIDVYRRKLPACRDLELFALFVAYFPQLVAGPIERAGHLLKQLSNQRVVNLDMLYSGAFLIFMGLFKKVGIADTLAPQVELAFGSAATAGWGGLVKGICLFTIQIYCDFCGYTDIARGCSRLMGIELAQNFAQPYLSSSITEFWRRWHISLSTWLRDYLYIPLGGSKGGTLKTYRNLMLTMILGGLWHGANWTFVVWGALHGLYLSIHKWLLDGRKIRLGDNEAQRWSMIRILKIVGTLQLVMLAWIFFRAPDFTVASDYLMGILTFRGGMSAVHVRDVAYVVFFGALVLFLDLPQFLRSAGSEIMLTWRWPVRGVTMAAMLLFLAIVGGNEDVPFIYFQF